MQALQPIPLGQRRRVPNSLGRTDWARGRRSPRGRQRPAQVDRRRTEADQRNLQTEAQSTGEQGMNPWNLTKREEQVLSGLVENYGSVKMVAAALGISFKTVDTFLGRA